MVLLLRTIDVLCRAVLDKRIVSAFLLLLVVVFVDNALLNPYFSELDILEHFLFGFILSEISNRMTTAMILHKLLPKATMRHDLLARLLGFLIVGGLLWESMEYFLFPAFGVRANPFFTFPITLYNVDGAIDVAVGILGCLIAWYTAKKAANIRAISKDRLPARYTRRRQVNQLYCCRTVRR